MAKHILQFDELESCGQWSCISIKDVGRIGNQWYTPARALGMELSDFVELIVRKFSPDRISFSDVPPNGLLLFSWESQTQMRKYKNWINKELRRVQFFVE